MSGKTNKLKIKESRKDYCKEAAEETKALAQGDNEFDGADDEFEKACAVENALDTARAEESVPRARSHRAKNMAGYATGTANNPKEEDSKIFNTLFFKIIDRRKQDKKRFTKIWGKLTGKEGHMHASHFGKMQNPNLLIISCTGKRIGCKICIQCMHIDCTRYVLNLEAWCSRQRCQIQ